MRRLPGAAASAASGAAARKLAAPSSLVRPSARKPLLTAMSLQSPPATGLTIHLSIHRRLARRLLRRTTRSLPPLRLSVRQLRRRRRRGGRGAALRNNSGRPPRGQASLQFVCRSRLYRRRRLPCIDSRNGAILDGSI